MLHSSPMAVCRERSDHVGDAVRDILGGENLGLFVEGVRNDSVNPFTPNLVRL